MSPRIPFAVVREDPNLECELVNLFGASAVLAIGSGGCTALTLGHRFPAMHVTVFDPNEAQLAHIRQKAEAVARGDLAALNVENPSPKGLNQRGAFEGMFRILRRFLEEFVADRDDLARFFARETSAVERLDMVESWIASPYWAAAFRVVFVDAMLVAVFGAGSVQPQRRAAYPEYFQRCFERGLRREDAATNPFLQHVFLGCYLAEDAPDYIAAREVHPIEYVHGSLLDVPDLHRFDLFSISNMLDTHDEALIGSWTRALCREAVPGAALLIRRLRNERDIRPYFTPWFSFDDAVGESFLAKDRSLFYDRIEVAFRTENEPPPSSRRPPSYQRLRKVDG